MLSHQQLFERLAQIPDPEIPAVTLADLGILRGISWEDDVPVVELTPTYSGCPATEVIRADVMETLRAAGYQNARVRLVLQPAWSTDWISPEGRAKLRAYGIAPPACASSAVAQPISQTQVVRFHPPQAGVTCPHCGSLTTEMISRFGSTPCKALYRCLSCKEAFDYFKPF